MEAITKTGSKSPGGFTLVELLVVLVLVSILAAIVAPMVGPTITRAKESALREDLFVVRKGIDDYYADKGVYPASLAVLREERYLRKIPLDPLTETQWALVFSKVEPRGVIDLHSTSEQIASDGTQYASW